MTTFKMVVFAACLVAGVAQAKDAVPQFKDYPARVDRGKAVAPIIDTPLKRNVKTHLRNGAKEPANFAGHYVVVRWSCGSPCIYGMVVDKLTGRVLEPPNEEMIKPRLPRTGDPDIDDYVTQFGMTYSVGSRRLVMTNMINYRGADCAKPAKQFVFTLDGGKWRYIRTITHPGKRWDWPEKPHDWRAILIDEDTGSCAWHKAKPKESTADKIKAFADGVRQLEAEPPRQE